jgi:hypothetical protein
MDAVDEITRARSLDLIDRDGERVDLVVHPAAAPAQIEALDARLGLALPRELRALLAHTAGIDGILDVLDFTGRDVSFESEDMFPAGHPIAHDGYGNHWVVDITPGERDVAPVFFACHDPPVVLFQSPGLGHFLREVFGMVIAPHASLVDDVHEDRLFNVWGSDPDVIDHPTALAADDELAAFAARLDERFSLVDLRSPQVGMGFAWGRHGPRTQVRRDGYRRLFACAPPEKRRRRWLR